jgi:hypothetical protein
MTIEASAAQSARIDHYTAFWSEVVGPDYEELMKAQHDLRLAFHCAVSLFHMSDWVYEAEKATVDASFTFIDKNGALLRLVRKRPVRSTRTSRYVGF